MSKKNIVSIEDRIPKLKQARKKKANRRLIFYLTIFFCLISIIVYLQSPLSHIKNIHVEGNTFVADEQIIASSNLTTDTNIWTINKEKIEASILKDPLIESVSVDRSLPRAVTIGVKEQKIIGYIRNEKNYYPVLGNGEMLQMEAASFNGNAPLLYGFDDANQLERLAGELEGIPKSILNLISEVHWKPTEDNKNTILLYMNDGYVVEGSLRDFGEKMGVYPSIVSQLDPEDKGTIHIGVGVYFESFTSGDEEEERDITEEVEEAIEETEESGTNE